MLAVVLVPYLLVMISILLASPEETKFQNIVLASVTYTIGVVCTLIATVVAEIDEARNEFMRK